MTIDAACSTRPSTLLRTYRLENQTSDGRLLFSYRPAGVEVEKFLTELEWTYAPTFLVLSHQLHSTSATPSVSAYEADLRSGVHWPTAVFL